MVVTRAEHLIEQGTLINGAQFKTNESSLQRLRELMEAFDEGLVGSDGKTYTTSAGVPITFTSKAEVKGLYRAAILYRSAVLERSSEIQQAMEGLANPLDPRLWDTSRPLDEIMAELNSA